MSSIKDPFWYDLDYFPQCFQSLQYGSFPRLTGIQYAAIPIIMFVKFEVLHEVITKWILDWAHTRSKKSV